jgi:hypothetical protein
MAEICTRYPALLSRFSKWTVICSSAEHFILAGSWICSLPVASFCTTIFVSHVAG